MFAQQGRVAVVCCSSVRTTRFALVIILSAATMVIGNAPAAHSQTFQILHSFSDGADGGLPMTGLVMDRAGNLYGVSQRGANGYGGVVFKMTRRGSSWTFAPLHNFVRSEGIQPAGITIGPDGNVYGVNSMGGGMGCGTDGCGTVFKLTPPARICANLNCPWPATILYGFQGGSDGEEPVAGVIFDQAGNLYGTTWSDGGASCCGVAYELSPGNGSWRYSVIHAFGQPGDGSHPEASLTFDNAGNLYGTTSAGGDANLGTVFQLAPSPSGWSETVLWSFLTSPDGFYPFAGLSVDPAGNLYGTTTSGGSSNNCPLGCGAVFEVSPENGGWSQSVLHSFDLSDGAAFPYATLTRDAAGNLYGTTTGYNTNGTIFKLTPTSGGWIYTSLHDFQGNDGEHPYGAVFIDAEGNLYGTALEGGALGVGVVWELTP